MDSLAALRLQLEWGADEALDEAPIDRLRDLTAPAPVAAPTAVSLVAPAVRGTPAERAKAAAVAADSLPALREAIDRFDGCALRNTAANLVFAEGDAAAGLLMIGEAPSADDDRAGRPITGPAGAYLDRMLASIGLDRTALLLSPLIPWRPPGDRPPNATELALCLPFLHRLIVLSAPRLIVLLGPLATNTLLGAGSARRQRGKWSKLVLPEVAMEIPVLPSVNPATLLGSHRGDASRIDPSLRGTDGQSRRGAWAEFRALSRTLASALAPN